MGRETGKYGGIAQFSQSKQAAEPFNFKGCKADKNHESRKNDPSAIGVRPVRQLITHEGLQSRRTAKRHFALALVASLISYPGSAIAQEGTRELTGPAAMQNVPPVRAVGIRLSPAAPLAINQISEPKHLPTNPRIEASPLPASPIGDALPTPAPGDTKSRGPERIIPKSKVSGTASENSANRGPLIKPQTPIQISISPSEGIRTVSGPSSPTKQPEVSGLVATEENVVRQDTVPPNPGPNTTLPNTSLEPAPRILSNIPMRARVSTSELDRATLVHVDTQSTHEIALDFPIQSVVVDDEKICRAMSSGGCVCILGLTPGESIIEVRPTDNQRPAQVLRIKVVSPWQRSGGAADLDQLVHAIQPLNPSGDLKVQALEDGSIVVRGKVENKEVAKRIMETIRKLILVPVVDKLEIR
jgi:hypothetical protein